LKQLRIGTVKKKIPVASGISKKEDRLDQKKAFDISKTKMTMDYLFGEGVSKKIDFSKISFVHSRKTGRIRQLEEVSSGKVLFTFRPNGSIAPTLLGAKLLLSGARNFRAAWIITVMDGVSEIVAQGKTVFCKHVVRCEDALRANDDVVILNEKKELLAVGRAVINGRAMKEFKRGQAVKVREGASQYAANESQ
jgi:predicted RNA-binding protein (TIGR00451 family)